MEPRSILRTYATAMVVCLALAIGTQILLGSSVEFMTMTLVCGIVEASTALLALGGVVSRGVPGGRVGVDGGGAVGGVSGGDVPADHQPLYVPHSHRPGGVVERGPAGAAALALRTFNKEHHAHDRAGGRDDGACRA
ncbi:hypothetical protein [Corynebacterium sp. MC3]|uniref:hypothetical protein n=1 Tax=Corynebacterium sp. MC3 TaxID=1720193 RepID=UPI00115F8537|nr:hypothetical protein [Corynebacterium sp. MC3]